MSKSNTLAALSSKSEDCKLSVEELACALYEGSCHLQNLAEKLARQHGKADGLPYYDHTSEHLRNFWRGLASQLIEHSKEWQPNRSSGCVLSERETERLQNLPRVTE